MSDKCIPLKGSTACPAWPNAAVTKDPKVAAKLYVSTRSLSLGPSFQADEICSPFLEYVSNLQEFDDKLHSYVRNEFAKQR